MMALNTGFKLIKEKKLDKNSVLRISKSMLNGRIFVEYNTVSPKLLLQKNFQDTYYGRLESEEFARKFKNTNDLKNYFGLK